MSFPKIFSKNAILGWSVAKDYAIGEICRGGAVLYCSKLASGPSTTAGSIDPANDDGTYWTVMPTKKLFSEDNDSNCLICGSSDNRCSILAEQLDVITDLPIAQPSSTNYHTLLAAHLENADAMDLSSDDVVFDLYCEHSASAVGAGLRARTTDQQKSTAIYLWNYYSGDRQIVLSGTIARPWSNNVCSLGTSGQKFTQLYAVTATINTSDQRLKDTITPVPDNVLDAWSEVDFVQYQMKDSLQEKGSAARFHSGLIAQSIDQAFSKHNLDASRYGLFCYDEWDAEPEELDENGGRVREAQPAGNQYSLRYEEALCMEAAYQRRQNSRTESRFLDLEQRLALLEEKIKQEEK